MKANKNTLEKENPAFSLFIYLVVISILFSFNSCSEENEGFGPYYEGTFSDEIFLGSKLDSVNIIIEQLGIIPKIKEVIPYSIAGDLSLSDSIKLKLLVSFGSNSKNPKVIEEIRESEDSIIVWYSTRSKYFKTLYKSSGLLEMETSPEIEYVSVDSVVIYKGVDKSVKFFSRRLS